jgi:hypothetical protein
VHRGRPALLGVGPPDRPRPQSAHQVCVRARVWVCGLFRIHILSLSLPLPPSVFLSLSLSISLRPTHPPILPRPLSPSRPPTLALISAYVCVRLRACGAVCVWFDQAAVTRLL